MNIPIEAVRVVIAGASSLRGKDLTQCLEESAFPLADVRLVDEEIVAGSLTEVVGEPAVIETVDEESFDRARFAFFAGSVGFSVRHSARAQSSGAVVIDLSGGLAADPGARSWIPPSIRCCRPRTGIGPKGEPQSVFLVPRLLPMSPFPWQRRSLGSILNALR